MNDNIIISGILPIEKSNEFRLIKKRKELLDFLYVEKYSSKENLDNDKKTLLEDIRALEQIIDPKIPEESWMLPELEKIEDQLTEKENLGEYWNNISNENYGEILEILEKKYRAAYEGCDAKEMENVLYLIRVVKKRIDNEIAKNIIEGKCSEDIISLNNQIGKIKHNLYKI